MSPSNPVERSAEEWKQSLTPEQFQVARCGGTERAFTGAYWNNKATGMSVSYTHLRAHET